MGLLLVSFLPFTSGCQQSDNDNSSPNKQIETATPQENSKVSFSFDLKALKTQTLTRTTDAKEKIFGTLTARDISTNAEKIQNWLISVDDANWNVESKTTMLLPPGDYQFSMIFKSNTQQYSGLTNGTIQDGTNDIKMVIYPLIGDTITDVNIVARLPHFKFSFSELNLTNFTQPQIAMEVDGNDMGLFVLDQTNGLGDRYFQLTPGDHTIKLKLYDGTRYIGKSKTSQERQTITLDGSAITMDLQPLYGETTFSLTTDGSEATFQFQIPIEVIEEANGKENLAVNFTMESVKNTPTKTVSLEIGDTSGDFYVATIGMEDQKQFKKIFYDRADLILDFADKRETGDNAILGSCNTSVTLTKTLTVIPCDLTLRKRAIAGGQLLSIIGVNVYGTTNNEVEGAILKTQNGKILGTTGTGSFGTKGYSNFLLSSGQYTVRATKGSLHGSIDISTDVFEVKNYDIFLRNSYKSCKEIKESVPNSDNGTYTIDPDGPEGANEPFNVYCDMQTDGGGWTLALKANGSKETFAYDTAYWTNEVTLNSESTDISKTEHKNRSFSTVPFSTVRLTLDTAGDIRSMNIPKTASSLQAVFNGGYQSTNMGRAAWKGMVHDSSLQFNCNREGFNSETDDLRNGTAKVRLGILANGQNDCVSPDSWLGIGGYYHRRSSSVGNYVIPDNVSDNGGRNTNSFGYLYIR